MKIKEVIEYLEESKPIPLFARDDKSYDEYIGDDIERINKMIDLLQSLEAENKALKKEIKAYKGMWEELPNKLEDIVLNNCLTIVMREMDKLKKQYLGGGE